MKQKHSYAYMQLRLFIKCFKKCNMSCGVRSLITKKNATAKKQVFNGAMQHWNVILKEQNPIIRI